MGKIKKDNGTYQLWLMALPAILYIAIFNYVPMYGIQLAFRDYDFSKGITGGRWAGLFYFKQYIKSPLFMTTLRNTFVISFASIVLGFPMPILLALAMNQIRHKGIKKILQTTVYLPHFISTVVMVSLINIFLSQNRGILNLLLVKLHILSSRTNFLGMPEAFTPIYVISGIWQNCGWNSIIYMAALSGADPQLYDACKIDGANHLQVVRYVEIPVIIPTIIILLILNMGGILSVGFEKVYLMQNQLNLSASQVISTYVYSVGMQSSQFSFGAAVGLFNTAINFLFLILTNFISKKVSDISLM
jgi:putative aldouronate transport system permease protein